MNARALLIVCPDYASHFYPLSAVAAACAQRGMAVTFATGPGMGKRAHALGFGVERIVLGPGSNTGLMRPEEQGKEAAHIRAFFEATRRGPVATLLYQSHARRHDMLHAPEEVHARLSAIVDAVRPDIILVDQLSYSATLALHALRRPFISFHPGSPAGIPAPGALFGCPTTFPAPLPVAPSDLATLRDACRRTTEEFTARFNMTLARLAPEIHPVADAFAFTSPWGVLLNYPASLNRRPVPPGAHFLGSCLRREEPDLELAQRYDRLPPDRPTVYVSFGTFLSARQDALGRVVAALRHLQVNVVLASGATASAGLEPLPPGWIVRPHFPQLQALARCDLVITHGGANTITEALSFGVPVLVGPFSSDQFDNAADVFAAGVGEVFDPNDRDVEGLSHVVRRLLMNGQTRDRAREVGRRLRRRPGPLQATRLLEAALSGRACSA